jgi:hypothetical protein
MREHTPVARRNYSRTPHKAMSITENEIDYPNPAGEFDLNDSAPY